MCVRCERLEIQRMVLLILQLGAWMKIRYPTSPMGDGLNG